MVIDSSLGTLCNFDTLAMTWGGIGRVRGRTGYLLHRENRGNCPPKKLSVKLQGISKFCQNTGKLVCSSCKFPDSRGKRKHRKFENDLSGYPVDGLHVNLGYFRKIPFPRLGKQKINYYY